jgi:type I restriction enzyme S subunit
MNQIVRLGDIAEVVRGVTYQRDAAISCPSDGYTPVLRAGNIQDQLILNDDLVWLPTTQISARQLLQPNDVLMCTSSGSADVVGKSAFFDNDSWSGSFGAFCAVIRANPRKCEPTFLKHILKAPAFLRWARSSLGANIKNIRKSELELFQFHLPVQSEQWRIAGILDKADGLRRKRQEAIRRVNEFLKVVFIDMFGDPSSNVKEFELGTIRDLVASATYGTSEKARDDVGEYSILRMNNITYEGNWDFSSLKYVDLDSAIAHKYLAQRGDLLFNRTNSRELVGKTAVYMQEEPMAIAGYLVRVRMNERGNPHYVSGYLNSTHGKQTLASKAKSIVGMANINAQEMQDISILIPPKDLQDKYARLVEEVGRRVSKQHMFAQQAKELQAALINQFLGSESITA